MSVPLSVRASRWARMQDCALGVQHLLVNPARIRAIRREGLEPIVRTIAAGLTEQDALLIETTLIWKLGKNLTNLAPGHFVSLFRPHNTLHKELPGFDFQNGIYLVNVGEGRTRNWDDCQHLGFLATGGDPKWSTQLCRLTEGDVVVAYLKSRARWASAR